jgi:hypothetical protein
VKNTFLAACLTVAALFAWSASEANADHWHHGHHNHGHHHGHSHYGHYHHHGNWHPGAYPVGGYWTGYFGPPVSRVYSYPSYYYAPPVQVYHYDYYRPQNSLFIGGRNFAFGIDGF